MEGRGVRGCINKNITKYSGRHLSYFLCPTALPCSSARGLCSLFLRAVDPIHRSSCDESLLKKKKNPSDGNMQLSAWLCMCVVWGFMLVWSICGHPSIHGRSLLKVGVVRKGIDILLDHFVAELVLLLRRWRGREKHTHQLELLTRSFSQVCDISLIEVQVQSHSYSLRIDALWKFFKPCFASRC